MGGSSDEKCLKKTNLLVYQTPRNEKKTNKPESPCDGKKSFRPPICRPKTKQIHICTGKEMKKMCAPKLCDCNPPRAKGPGLMGVLGFGLKAALAAAAIYVSYDIGIWGTADDTQDLYKSYCKLKTQPHRQETKIWDPPSCEAERDFFRMPSFNPYGHCEVPPIDQEKEGFKMQQCWNRLVASTFSALAGFPNNIVDKISGDSRKAEDTADATPQCIPFDELSEEERILNKYK